MSNLAQLELDLINAVGAAETSAALEEVRVSALGTGTYPWEQLPLSAIDAALRDGLSKGWLQQDGAWVRPTERGFDFLSDLQSLFLTD